VTLSTRQEVLVSTTLRLRSVRVLLMLLCAALAAVALAVAPSTAGAGRHSATLGSARPSAGKVALSNREWN